MRPKNIEPLNLSDESMEMLLLIAVFGNETFRQSAVRELKKRRALHHSFEDDNLVMTNLSGIC
ncbi:MAG TPA: hypothetical protein PKY88_02285 [Anaerohalosphaeraceae bacterium]|nr:hypothetical protein [Anaerohalosphaeraceae bacterium]